MSLMKRLCSFFFFLLFGTISYAQGPYLKPSIGLASLPADNTPICPPPVYLGNYDTSGYFVGDTVADFTLYKANGNPVSMSALLQSHRPVLLVAGSYTCGEFRSKVADLDSMMQFYGGLLNIIVVYIVEAHPDNAVSPYTGNIWIGNQNIQANIYYDQPTTYGERKAMVDTMNAHMPVMPMVAIDGPCNEWWLHFGPAPNNAYLIDTNGIVKSKAGWFNHPPENMWCSIDSLLGTNSGHCNALTQNGIFDFHLVQDSIINGLPGDVLTSHGVLKNLSPFFDCTVNIEKTGMNLPSGWETALCTDICLPANVNNTQIVLAPSDTQSFVFYFYTDSTLSGSGHAQVTFTNAFNQNNVVRQKYYGHTAQVVLGTPGIEGKQDIETFPNPVHGSLHVKFPETTYANITLTNVEGKTLKKVVCNYCSIKSIDLSSAPPGIYWLQVTGDQWNKNVKVAIE